MEIIPFKPDHVDAGPCPACENEGTCRRYDATLRLLIIECAHCEYPWFAMQPAFMQENGK